MPARRCLSPSTLRRDTPAVSTSSTHMQSRQRGPGLPATQPSLGAFTSFSLVLGVGDRAPSAGGLHSLPGPPPGTHTHPPVHSADRGGELGLQPENEGLHQPVDAGLFRGLGAMRQGGRSGPAESREHGLLYTTSPRVCGAASQGPCSLSVPVVRQSVADKCQAAPPSLPHMHDPQLGTLLPREPPLPGEHDTRRGHR